MSVFLGMVGWWACIVYSTIPAYWLLIHPWANYWRSRQNSPFRVLLPLWVAMWLMVALLTVRWRRLAFYETPWSWAPAVMFFAAGFWIYIRSGKQFSAKQLGGLPELLPGHREQLLVTSGIRSRVRHPIYLGHLCEMLGWSIGTGLAICYGLTAFAILTGTIMIHMEDTELEQRFGEAYRKYRATVPAWLPRIS